MAPFFATGVSVQIERRDKRRDRTASEREIKAAVKRRDSHRCRWPRCEYHTIPQVIDCAHLQAAGMGGDPRMLRMTEDNLIAICRLHHRKAPISLHSGDLKIVPLTDAGANGRCEFWHGSQLIGTELSPGVLIGDVERVVELFVGVRAREERRP